MRGNSINTHRRLKSRKILERIAYLLFLLAILISITGLLTLLIRVAIQGIPWFDWEFLTSFPSRFPEKAGIKASLAGTMWLMGLTGMFTVPIGIGAAIYLEEYASKNRFTRIIELNMSNLAGVPSIVYGLLGFALFVQLIPLGRSIIAAALTLTLLVLPIVILASREAIRAVPKTYRDAAYALGSTKWEVTKRVVLPAALPGILTGIILSLSRAIGEAAPLIAIAALVYVHFVPTSPLDRFSALPIQIYGWVTQPQDGFRNIAAAGILLLLFVLLSMNSVAIYLRNKFQIRSGE